MLYETLEEVDLRLRNSVFLYKDDVVLCSEVRPTATPGSGGFKLTCLPLPRGEEFTVNLNNDDLNYRCLQLGYCNMAQGAVYLQRMPVRRFKQGIVRENLVINQYPERGGRPGWDVLRASIGFRDMMRGVYPSVEEAIERLKGDDDPKSVAFHRLFAIGRDPFRGDNVLYYKDRKVGFGSNDFKVPPEYEYLLDHMKESGIRC